MIEAPIRPSARLEEHNTEISGDALVENRITGLLDKDNAYMRQADTRGNQQAQRRGLLSSSLAVGAVENERIAAALPIAQQDASLYGQRDLQDSAYAQQGKLNAQNYQNQGQIINQQGTISGNLQVQQGGIDRQNMTHQGGIFRQNATHQGGIDRTNMSHQGNINSRLQNEQAGHNRGLATHQGNINSRLQGEAHANNSNLSTQNFAQNQQLQSENQVATIRLNTSNQIGAIEQNPNMSAAQKNAAIQNLLNLQNSQIRAIERSGPARSNFTYPPGGGSLYGNGSPF